MAKRPLPGKCIHCLQSFEILNWDHVFPESWYPDTTPLNLYKWQIPSCVKCNNDYGRIEKDLMIRIGLCLDPDDPASRGIVRKAMRSIDLKYGRNNKDKKAREAKKQQIMKQFLDSSQYPKTAIYPNFGPAQGYSVADLPAITISAKSIARLNEKIVRGLMYLEDDVFIEPPYIIESFTLTDDKAKPIMDTVKKYGVIHAKEPEIIVKRATVPEDKTSSLFAIEIWGKFKMYSSVAVGNA